MSPDICTPFLNQTEGTARAFEKHDERNTDDEDFTPWTIDLREECENHAP